MQKFGASIARDGSKGTNASCQSLHTDYAQIKTAVFGKQVHAECNPATPFEFSVELPFYTWMIQTVWSRGSPHP